MAESKQRHDWAIGCELVAAVYNANRGDGPAIKGTDINPFAKRAISSKDRLAIELRDAREMWRARYGNK
jgi:hypothetical protein